MVDWVHITFIIGLLMYGIILHEYIHYFFLKKYGYSEKVMFVPKMLGIGFRIIGTKDNVVCAWDMQRILIAPLIPTTFAFFLCYSVIVKDFNELNLLYAELFAIGACSYDIYSALRIRVWWGKSIDKMLRREKKDGYIRKNRSCFRKHCKGIKEAE